MSIDLEALKKTGALCLSRRVGEGILIGDDIYFEISDITPRQVKLHFHAPKEVKIVRTELLQKIVEKEDEKKNNF